MTNTELQAIRRQCQAKVAEYEAIWEQPGLAASDSSERAHWEDLAVEALGAKQDAELMLRLVEEVERLRHALAKARGFLVALDLILNEHGLAKAVRKWVKEVRRG